MWSGKWMWSLNSMIYVGDSFIIQVLVYKLLVKVIFQWFAGEISQKPLMLLGKIVL